MIDYTMPVLSQQGKIHAIYDAEERVQALKLYCKLNPDDKQAAADFLLMEIALAALTAKPVGYGLREDIQLMKSKKMMYGAMTVRFQGEEALFAAPPVPVKQEGEQ